MSTQEHWDAIYQHRRTDEVSWYRAHLERSLQFIEEAALAPTAAILDVGGGASTLVDDLLERGFRNVTVLDLSASAIARTKERLKDRAGSVTWLVGDVTQLVLPGRQFDFWHDRAVFHFLTEEDARRRYAAAVRRALKPGALALIATFGPAGPEKCSGLRVVRYSADGIHAQLGDAFEKVGEAIETHCTPGGKEQQFVYCLCRMRQTRG